MIADVLFQMKEILEHNCTLYYSLVILLLGMYQIRIFGSDWILIRMYLNLLGFNIRSGSL